jgi:hypothetical protein
MINWLLSKQHHLHHVAQQCKLIAQGYRMPAQIPENRTQATTRAVVMLSKLIALLANQQQKT